MTTVVSVVIGAWEALQLTSDVVHVADEVDAH
jgi:hypothetical protein